MVAEALRSSVWFYQEHDVSISEDKEKTRLYSRSSSLPCPRRWSSLVSTDLLPKLQRSHQWMYSYGSSLCSPKYLNLPLFNGCQRQPPGPFGNVLLYLPQTVIHQLQYRAHYEEIGWDSRVWNLSLHVAREGLINALTESTTSPCIHLYYGSSEPHRPSQLPHVFSCVALRSRCLFNRWAKARSPFTSSWTSVFVSRTCFLCWFGWRYCVRSVELFIQTSRTCSRWMSYSLTRRFLNTQLWIEPWRALDWRVLRCPAFII